MEYKKHDPLFTISIASQLSGLNARTLMLYEKAGLIKPFRTKTDRRRYSLVEIEKIKFIHYIAQERRINLAGIRLFFEIMDFAEKHGLKIAPEFFPNFKA